MRIWLLGPLEVRDARGEVVGLGGARLRAVVTLLALEAPGWVGAGRLAADLWPEEPPANPANAVQALVSRLRAVLGRDAVESSAAGYRLAGAEVDVHVFERRLREARSAEPERAAELLAEALGLWRGPALADTPELAEPVAARLESLRRDARDDLAEARLALGRAAELVAELRARCAEDPLRDRPRAQLVRALAATGRTAEALAQYEEARALLAERLGTDPSPALRAAHAEALRADEPPAPVAPAAPPSALPAQLTSFIGRETEVRTAAEELGRSRLVTLTGPGGAGKTRLALETAAALAAEGRFPHGVRLVELAPVSDPAELPGAVLAALRIREPAAVYATRAPQPAREAVSVLVAALAGRELLLVLDNCEHLVSTAAGLAARLLADCPGLRVLATSREPLGITGERLLPVPSLAFPPPGAHDLTPCQALDYPAVRLFAERGAAVVPAFAVDEARLPAVADICRALDGQPLAIELAAARLRTLTPQQIAERLDARFRLLTTGSRTALPRHRTLRAVVDWSWDLLEKPERTLLARLSVFAGGAALETVEEVCSDECALPAGEILDTLASLVDKSLVVPLPGGRYRLLETIRAYAAERLAEAGEEAEAAVRDAHTAAFVRFTAEGEPRLRTREQLVWLERYRTEHDNLIAALRWAVRREDADAAVRLVAGVGWYLWMRGDRGEHLPLIRQALDLPRSPATPPVLRAAALGITSFHLAEASFDVGAAMAVLDSAIAERDAHGAGDEHALLPLLDILRALFRQEDRRVLEHASRLRQSGNPWGRAAARLFAGFALQNDGRAAEAEEYLKQALEEFRQLDELWGQAFCLQGLAEHTRWRGELDEAVQLWEEAIRLTELLGMESESGESRARLLLLRANAAAPEAVDLAELEEQARDAERTGSWMMTLMAHQALAERYRLLGRPEQARELLHSTEAALPPALRVMPQVRAVGGTALGLAEADCGDLDAAERTLRGALASATTAYDGPVVAGCLDAWADLMLRRGDAERAAELLGAAERQRGVPDLSSREARRVYAAVRQALGKEAYAAAHGRGRAAPRAEVIASLGAAVPEPQGGHG